MDATRVNAGAGIAEINPSVNCLDELSSLEDSPCSSDLSDTEDKNMLHEYQQQQNHINKAKQELLKKLAIVEMTSEIKQSIPSKPTFTSRSKATKKLYKGSPVGQRKSLRLQRKEPTGVDISQGIEENDEISKTRMPATQFPMEAEGFDALSTSCDGLKPENVATVKQSVEEYTSFMKTLANIDRPDVFDLLSVSQAQGKTRTGGKAEQKSYKDNVKSIKSNVRHTQKLVRKRITSLAIHPSTDTILVAVGDKQGNLGLWTVAQPHTHGSHYSFTPHVRMINCLKFSKTQPNKLYMCSFDGQLRSMDLHKKVFDETIIDDESCGFMHFDFMDQNKTLVASRYDGCVDIIDMRVKKTDKRWSFEAHDAPAKCVSVHPTQNSFLATSGRDSLVKIFDTRKVSQQGKRSKPVVTLSDHGRTVNSAYFSPVSGNNLLTTSYDDRIRLFDTHTISKQHISLSSSCRHNNNTGRWVTPFRATWHPNRDSVFVIGSMKRPRQVDIYNSNMEEFHILHDPEALTTVCAVNCFHEAKNLLACGNASGRVFIFEE